MPVALANIRSELLPGLLDVRTILGGTPRNLEAEKKSVDLLKSWLTPTQFADYEKKGQFAVKGSHSGDIYWIGDGSMSYNVVHVKAKRGYGSERMCFVPDGASAGGDVMLAQKIMLETDEPKAHEIANKQYTRIFFTL